LSDDETMATNIAKHQIGRLVTSLFVTSDEQLMWRVKLQDDALAFAKLLDRWEKPIQRLCLRMTGDAHRAEDLTQMTFSRVFTRRADWEPSGKFSTFLWRVALNLCHDEARRVQRRGEFSLEALEEADGAGEARFAADELSPDAHAEVQERGEQVRRALAELPALYREVVVLRHYEGLKFREISEVLDIPEGTVKSRMAEALTQLNRRLNYLNEDESCNHKNHNHALRLR
jgi:RNA polymerase sigma-70 factor (ECF subfamily)